jgi:plastocyanin
MTPLLFRIFFGMCLLPCALVSAEAVVEGHVDLPKPRAATVASKHYEIVTNGGVIATDPPQAVIYLEGSFPKAPNPPIAEMAQKDLAFVTPLLPVQIGTKVEFPNLDSTYHNIFSYSAAKRFDLGRYRSDERPIPSQVFDVPGLVTLHCDIHQHMRALILVLNTSHFTKSDTDGRYRLNGLPAGQYVLKAWVNSSTTLEHPVVLKNGETVHIDFP